MACCFTAPSHYLNQCWFIIKGVLSHAPESNIMRSVHESVMCLEITALKLLPHLPGANELKSDLCHYNAHWHNHVILEYVIMDFHWTSLDFTSILAAIWPRAFCLVFVAPDQMMTSVWSLVNILRPWNKELMIGRCCAHLKLHFLEWEYQSHSITHLSSFMPILFCVKTQSFLNHNPEQRILWNTSTDDSDVRK